MENALLGKIASGADALYSRYQTNENLKGIVETNMIKTEDMSKKSTDAIVQEMNSASSTLKQTAQSYVNVATFYRDLTTRVDNAISEINDDNELVNALNTGQVIGDVNEYVDAVNVARAIEDDNGYADTGDVNEFMTEIGLLIEPTLNTIPKDNTVKRARVDPSAASPAFYQDNTVNSSDDEFDIEEVLDEVHGPDIV